MKFWAILWYLTSCLTTQWRFRGGTFIRPGTRLEYFFRVCPFFRTPYFQGKNFLPLIFREKNVLYPLNFSLKKTSTPPVGYPFPRIKFQTKIVHIHTYVKLLQTKQFSASKTTDPNIHWVMIKDSYDKKYLPFYILPCYEAYSRFWNFLSP